MHHEVLLRGLSSSNLLPTGKLACHAYIMDETKELQLAESIAKLKASVRESSGGWRVQCQVAEVAEKVTREGKPYLEAGMVDATDTFVLRVWSEHAAYREVERLGAGAFVCIAGQFEVSPRYGLEVKSWRMRELNDDERQQLIEGPMALRAKVAEDFAEIERLVESLDDPRFLGVSRLFLVRYGERMRRTAAARSYHHARRGGLVEHVAGMMHSAEALCAVYPQLNRDLLLTGCLFHDCGKLFENCYEEQGFQMPVTKLGELLGHIPVGIELVNALWHEAAVSASEAWKSLEPPTDEARLHLLHLVAAHHGEYEYGSPTLPHTPEAIALHYIDNLDAKLEMFAAGYASSMQLAPGIFERVRPLPTSLVSPLRMFIHDALQEGERIDVNHDGDIIGATETSQASTEVTG